MTHCNLPYLKSLELPRVPTDISFSFPRDCFLLIAEHLQSSRIMAIEHNNMPNGTHDPMSLTMYSANPDEKYEKTPASASIPLEYLLPSGHPDVRELSLRSCDMTNIRIVSSVDSRFTSL